MTRLNLRAAVTLGHGGLVLTLRSEREELLGFLPGKLIADGILADGTLTLMADEEGNRSISYAGSLVQDVWYDYIQLPADMVGFEPTEPFLPQDVGASAEAGIVQLDAVQADSWIPRRYQGDPRIVRVHEALRTQSPRMVARRLTRKDRTDFDDVLAGKVNPLDVAPHVALLARLVRSGD